MQEVRYDDIRVSYVMPGSVATGFSSGDEAKGADWKVAPEEVAEVVVNLLRHNRAQPAEPRRAPAVEAAAGSRNMSVFDKHRDTLEHHETMMGTARGAWRSRSIC